MPVVLATQVEIGEYLELKASLDNIMGYRLKIISEWMNK
jgi:hypothetical protein